MTHVAFAFPTMWDDKQLAQCRTRWGERFTVELASPSDDDCPWDFDILAHIEQLVDRYRSKVDGIISSSDYPGATVAAAVSRKLGLPGSEPTNVIRCSHKYYSRLAQRQAAPEATAEFHLVSPGSLDTAIRFPCFVKPVKGAFSVMSRKIDSRHELEAFLAKPAVSDFLQHYVVVFNRLVAALTDFEIDGSHFIAEELLKGRQVTVEGFVSKGSFRVLGVVDSIRHRETKSFVRFEYPSSLPVSVQTRMASIAERVVTHLGLVDTMFNIEMMYQESRDRISIVEVNPRMCGQFADLYAKVDGTNGYEVALALASGEEPIVPKREGSFRVAASFPLRIFEPMRVLKAPDAPRIAEAEALVPETVVWSECSEGDVLSDFESIEDGKSARYAVVNIGASDDEALRNALRRVTEHLDYRFQPV